VRVTLFTIGIPEEVLADLKERLRRTRWPDELAGAGWDYGVSRAYLEDLVRYWCEDFDWRAEERALNQLPQFKAEVDGLGIHFIHVQGRGPDPLPLVVTHGWPGSFVEMTKLVPLLADPGAHGGDPHDAFDVVVPSLPGYGFSDRPREPGCSNRRIADLWAELMAGLGYPRFAAQGGDWGAGVSTWLALRHPEHVIGVHLNYIPGSYQPELGPGTPPLSKAEREFLVARDNWIEIEGAYGHLQATRPQTAAYGLNDSPVGLVAWLIEKYRDWSDCDGDVERRFTRDELLTQVTLYWVTGTIGSSMRLYRESKATPLRLGPGQRVNVPCGIARFAKEAPFPPREWVERGYYVRRWSELPTGGHFAALEEPTLLAREIREFFRELRVKKP
jgi:pimeloyl-ACP methyl ester carboxylesterase